MLSTQPFPSPYPKPLLVDLHPLSAVCLFLPGHVLGYASGFILSSFLLDRFYELFHRSINPLMLSAPMTAQVFYLLWINGYYDSYPFMQQLLLLDGYVSPVTSGFPPIPIFHVTFTVLICMQTTFIMHLHYYSSPFILVWKLVPLADMVDEISSLMDNLHFTEDETTDVPPLSNEEAEPDRDQETMLIGKILSTMLPDGDSFIRVFNSIWGTSILAIHMLQPHFFLFKFTNLASMAMIKHRGPGSFDGDMVAFTPFNPLLSLPELDFTRQLFWVRIYQLPLGLVDKC
ncbi:hypothetical protein V6N12_074973 [Hibiscus sabdariffa]|uniref:DUF4283 domain-containing protein n=1 Tax=Hibiscus sabdariffa TaxID=183260 RepID=A0ABR1Z6U2_9ROSI